MRPVVSVERVLARSKGKAVEAQGGRLDPYTQQPDGAAGDLAEEIRVILDLKAPVGPGFGGQ